MKDLLWSCSGSRLCEHQSIVPTWRRCGYVKCLTVVGVFCLGALIHMAARVSIRNNNRCMAPIPNRHQLVELC